ncbi:MAG: hypothetical protein K0B06_01665 [Brevefilum sp.]|nr:hypothetical protein [Brevefilum sp.]
MRTRLTFWILIALVFIFMLGGCDTQQVEPQSQPTSAPPASAPVITETLAESVEQVKGLWYMKHEGGAIVSLNGDGESVALTYSFVYVPAMGEMDTGTAKFENGKLTFLTSEGECRNHSQATYEIYIVKQDGLVIGMRGKAVAPDSCPGRIFETRDFLDYFDPILISKGTKKPSASGPELFGVWYDDAGILRKIGGTMNYETGVANMFVTTFNVLQDPWKFIGKTSAKYKDGKLILESNTGFCEDVGATTYEVFEIVYNDQIIGIHPRLVGDDLCAERIYTYDDHILRSIIL